MNAKDYVAIARVLAAELADNSDDDRGSSAVVHISLALAEVFAADNPRFDRERFFRAVNEVSS
jgi:hypothetical protein